MKGIILTILIITNVLFICILTIGILLLTSQYIPFTKRKEYALFIRKRMIIPTNILIYALLVVLFFFDSLGNVVDIQRSINSFTKDQNITLLTPDDPSPEISIELNMLKCKFLTSENAFILSSTTIVCTIILWRCISLLSS